MRRRSNSRLTAAFLGAAAAWALAGCTHGPGNSTPDGVLTVHVQPSATPVSGLVLTSGRAQIEGLTVLGDVAPDGRAMVSEFSLDLLSTGADFTLSMLPQGVYSRVRFSISEVQLQGSWRNVPLQVQFETGDGTPAIDVRSNGVEVTPGHDGELVLSIDDGAWFSGNVLDGAAVVNSQIVVDGSHNTAVTAILQARLAPSCSLADSTPIH